MPILSIIILSYNTKLILRDCLNSLLKFNKDEIKNGNYQVIVVDNASTDGSAGAMKIGFPWVRLIKSSENLGFSKGNNLGIKHADGRYILFLNSDTLVPEGSIRELVAFMDSHADVGVVGPRLCNKDGSPQPSAGSFPSLPVVFTMLFAERFGGGDLVRGSFDNIREVDWVMGAAILVKKDVVSRTNGFDENIFMYYDEVEWCYRIKKAGYKIYYYPKPQITHLWQGSSQSGRSGPILANFKSLIYFYEKHYSQRKLTILKLMIRLKCAISLAIGSLTKNNYLKTTYAQVLKSI